MKPYLFTYVVQAKVLNFMASGFIIYKIKNVTM